MFIRPSLLAGAFLTLSTSALALDSEGVYKITERQACADEHIDTVIFMSDQNGDAKAFFSSNEFGINYQVHALTVGADGSLSGSTLPSSSDAATFAATLSEDGRIMSGSVDTIVCPSAWTFTAERVDLPLQGGLSPLDQTPSLSDFVGSFSARTDFTEGFLRFIRLGDGHVIGGFGNDISSRLIDFYDPRLDVDASTLELFSPDYNGEVRVKWHLSYGKADGTMALQGYGISASGRLYSVAAKKL
jgi:hypothetical protein